MSQSTKPVSGDLTIGALASTVNVNVETIRYYQRVGLIDIPAKPQQGYRRYPASTAQRIRFIKRAQELGFTLQEITELLTLNDGDCEEARTLAEHKRDVIQQRIADLHAMHQALTKLISACQSNTNNQDHCAIIETLARTRRS